MNSLFFFKSSLSNQIIFHIKKKKLRETNTNKDQLLHFCIYHNESTGKFFVEKILSLTLRLRSEIELF